MRTFLIIKKLKKQGEKVLAKKLFNIVAKDTYVELVKISKKDLYNLSHDLKKPLGLILYYMGLKRSSKILPTKLKEPLKFLYLKEDNIEPLQRKSVLVFKKEKPFHMLERYFKFKKDHGEQRVTRATSKTILVKTSDLFL